jgi:hypothetical protein
MYPNQPMIFVRHLMPIICLLPEFSSDNFRFDDSSEAVASAFTRSLCLLEALNKVAWVRGIKKGAAGNKNVNARLPSQRCGVEVDAAVY